MDRLMFETDAENAISVGYEYALRKKHKYVTPEHVLYGICLIKNGNEVLKEAGVDTERLKMDLDNYFDDNISSSTSKPMETMGLRNVIEFASIQAMGSGKNKVTLGNLILGIEDNHNLFAYGYLMANGFDKLKFINYVAAIERNQSLLNDSDDPEILGDPSAANEVGTETKKKSMLELYTTNLTQKAKDGEIDPLIGRKDELERTIQILCRRNKNNPIHVGDPGVGKTALVEGLANLIAQDNVPEDLKGSEIFSLDMGSLISGTKFRGDFEERIKGVFEEIKKKEKAIVYIDEIHTIVGAGSTSGGSMDAANLLKPLLTQTNIKVIGSTTYDEYKKFFQKDKALSRRFQKIEIDEPSKEDTLKILQGLKSKYEEFHKVSYTDEAIETAVDLTTKYMNDRKLPDKAIDVLDETGAYVKLHLDEKTVNSKDIERTVALMAKIPEKTVSTDETEQLKNLDKTLKDKIYGQDEAINTIVKAIKYSRAGFINRPKPILSSVLVGQPGTGKTELCKQLASTLGIPLIRFDMSEYQEKYSASKLIGTAPGYVGYENGGLLTEAIKKNPYCVLLLDEIEKANQDIQNVLLQVMDYATLTDNEGSKIDFKNVILIMTSNAGAAEVNKNIIGFGGQKTGNEKITKAVEQFFSPAIRSRLDNYVVFNPMNKNILKSIAEREINSLQDILTKNNVSIKVTDKCYDWLIEKSLKSTGGAREMLKLIEQNIKPKFVDIVLFDKPKKNQKYTIDIDNDDINITK